MSMNRDENSLILFRAITLCAVIAFVLAMLSCNQPAPPEPRGPTIKGDSAAPPGFKPDRPADLDAKIIKALEGLRATNDAQNLAIAFIGQAVAPAGVFSVEGTTMTMQINPVKIDAKGNVQGGFKLGGRK